MEKAQKDAEIIVEKAREQAQEIRKNVNAELKLSSTQAISSVKQQITELITLKIVDQPVKDSFKDKGFMKELILLLVKNWASGDKTGTGISLLLPEKEKEDLEKFLEEKHHEVLDEGFEIKSDPDLETGFKVGPADGSYRISFTDEDFANFLKDYLRPRTNQLLYGGE
jgi:V/A-type H+-transporting ATPase subunit E